MQTDSAGKVKQQAVMRSRKRAQFLSTLYVFAVSDDLTATMTDEVYGLAQRFGLILKK
jgi:hypothetical protein